ncbi:hypothetical protein [Sphaerisporangium sp. NPDC051011]|uniref:hypothetical protein n=1 Tax=Sphaerisporangium sp. NPDC051011 TaxID=3155792 RepID=UPI00340464E1
MSGRLVGEVVEWLRTPPAVGLTQAERLVLLVIAERANEQTRVMWRHKGDAENLIDRIAGAVGVSVKSVGAVFGRLAKRGLEVRVPFGEDRNGRPVYATSGRAERFLLPALPAMHPLPERPERSRDEGTFPVDNPPADPVDNSSDAPAKVPPSKDLPAQRSRDEGTFEPERSRDEGTLVPLKTYPSKTNPSTPSHPIPQPDVEERPPVHSEPSARDHPRDGPPDGYAAARDYLATLPDLGDARIAAARAELGAQTPIAELVIHAAAAAHQTLARPQRDDP